LQFNVIPLLSPALSPHANRSAYASPAQNAFPVNSDIQPGSSSHYSRHDPQSRSPIEQLQEQQRQFQEQLILLQNQQRELQASAAAVAAASTSPYIPSSGASSGHTRLTNSPGLNGAHSGSASTPSPGNFSPLTSPALEASARAVHFNQHQGFSPVFGSQNQRGPHPLSNFSSPALNPVGSSGGAQQTLSPDLEPQGNTDPEYLSAFVGYLNEQQSLGEGQVQLIYPSPAISSTRQGSLSSPLAEGSSGTGPHRNSLPAKSRPSPMMKPRHHRSHARQSSASALPGHFSVPSSPMAQRYHPSATGMGYLPPAAIDQRGVQQHQQSMQRGPSTSSTPSPVDLSQIMPPPPLPTQNGGRKGITPMTPASLMNLGRANTDVEVGESQPIPTQKRQVTARKSSISPTVGTAKKANYGTKIAPNIGGRRALAMRPGGGIGVRVGQSPHCTLSMNRQLMPTQQRKPLQLP
jgi:hypothetical protein